MYVLDKIVILKYKYEFKIWFIKKLIFIKKIKI